ncbi:hypothetical protein [Nonomuraea sp. NEAU-A123]|uniref:hypothetical protein n=1 Tax=Nonomuraea sp. NEAU-A123 TaxID=2839649 RepID=UPI001BE494BC|nr:hypothetical protein [Nonomuraea sp. NEAU-A123]MBT2226982.1 hypothetical protein [Nonomuraea sp. NEAU-A123]
MSGEQRKFELSVPQIAGSALAAVTAAVAASYLGVGGTVIGAALMSVASTVATAVYTHYLKRTGDKVKQHTVIAWREYGSEQPPPERHEGQGELATAVRTTVREDEQRPGESTLVMAPIEVPAPRRVPWAKTGVAAALVFGVSMGGILAYQTIAQTTVHDQLTGAKPATEREQAPAKEKKRSEEPALQPRTTFSGAPATPSDTPTGSPTPTASPTRTSQSPTPAPTDTGKETAKNTVEPSTPSTTTTAQDPGDLTEETSVPTDPPQSPPVQENKETQ